MRTPVSASTTPRNKCSGLTGGIIFILAAGLVANAGTLSGNVKAGTGSSVVYLESTTQKKALPPPTQTYKMDQAGMKFVPNMLVVPIGAIVEFLNSDMAAHNVSWHSVGGDRRLAHNLGTFPKGQKASWKFDHPGAVPIVCSTHSEMLATIIVSPSPYYAQTDQVLGDYFIQNVPDGQYKVTVWNHGKTSSKQVAVAGNTKLDLSFAK